MYFFIINKYLGIWN